MFLGVLFAVIGLVFVGTGVAATSGRLPRNGVLGIRTHATMASDHAWKVAHHAAAWSFYAGGAVMLASAAILMAGRARMNKATGLLALGGPAVMAIVVLIGAWQADRLASRLR